jgi:hypothetical protein
MRASTCSAPSEGLQTVSFVDISSPTLTEVLSFPVPTRPRQRSLSVTTPRSLEGWVRSFVTGTIPVSRRRIISAATSASSSTVQHVGSLDMISSTFINCLLTLSCLISQLACNDLLCSALGCNLKRALLATVGVALNKIPSSLNNCFWDRQRAVISVTRQWSIPSESENDGSVERGPDVPVSTELRNHRFLRSRSPYSGVPCAVAGLGGSLGCDSDHGRPGSTSRDFEEVYCW